MENGNATALRMIFHGPWGFVMQADTLTAATAACDGHMYLLGDGPVLAPLDAGLYCFTDEGALVATPKPTLVGPQTIIGPPVPARFAIPDLRGDARVGCAFRLPPPDRIVNLFPAPRTPPIENDGAKAGALPAHGNLDNDNLLSGRDFRHLNQSAGAKAGRGSVAALALVQALEYRVNVWDRVGLMNQHGHSWAPQPAATRSPQGVRLHIYAQLLDPRPGSEDHFAMMAALFNLDLHLDGDDVNQRLPLPVKMPPPYQPADAKDIGDRYAGWLARQRGESPKPAAPMVYPFPIICGGSLLIQL